MDLFNSVCSWIQIGVGPRDGAAVGNDVAGGDEGVRGAVVGDIVDGVFVGSLDGADIGAVEGVDVVGETDGDAGDVVGDTVGGWDAFRAHKFCCRSVASSPSG
jgi:uncharacterized membrane protein